MGRGAHALDVQPGAALGDDLDEAPRHRRSAVRRWCKTGLDDLVKCAHRELVEMRRAGQPTSVDVSVESCRCSLYDPLFAGSDCRCVMPTTPLHQPSL
jgi:hypothetical protein